MTAELCAPRNLLTRTGAVTTPSGNARAHIVAAERHRSRPKHLAILTAIPIFTFEIWFAFSPCHLGASVAAYFPRSL